LFDLLWILLSLFPSKDGFGSSRPHSSFIFSSKSVFSLGLVLLLA
jgi:hypothetical protein